jgi:hypothetical protein
MVAVQGLQQMESAEQTRQASQQTQQLNQAKTLEAGITYMQHALALPTDQATYDAMLQKMASDGPAYAQMAAQLPKTYDPAQVEATLRRLAMIKQRAQGNQLGMQPIPATRDGKHIILRMAPGGLEEAQAPPGVEVTPQGVIREDTGTEIILRDRAGNILSRQPKEVQKAAEQKATGTASGKAAGELPEKLRDAQTTIASIGDQHGRVNKAIDAALSTMDRPGELPATGTVSTLYNVFGETNARMLRNQLKIIVSNMGLDQLLTLAKAGGRLGSVTEAEHKLLQSTIAALDPEGTVDSIKQQLQNVRDAVVQSRQRIQEAYDRDVAALQQAQPGTGQRQPGQGTPPRTVIPKDQAERVIQQFIQQGGTREQILETWRQKHIEVGQ